ncbi:MAG: hypothetical protein Q4G67_13105 [Actinomycetia bacterium]|nr:hypothetical protein [Actinomycetes bacterium]
MARYHGRHAARHAATSAPRHRLNLRGLRSAAPGLLAATIVVATGGAAVALAPATPATLAQGMSSTDISRTAAAQSAEQAATETEDSARLASTRAELNAARGQIRAELQAEEKEQSQIEARAVHEEHEERASQARARAHADRLAAALEVEAAQEDPQRAAQILMPEFGFGPEQWGCLESLWMGESDWRWWVANPTSGAYGIPQSLPAEKMAEMGDDWETNPVTQIRWGLDYIKKSYGTPCGAWEFWQSQSPHWY